MRARLHSSRKEGGNMSLSLRGCICYANIFSDTGKLLARHRKLLVALALRCHDAIY